MMDLSKYSQGEMDSLVKSLEEEALLLQEEIRKRISELNQYMLQLQTAAPTVARRHETYVVLVERNADTDNALLQLEEALIELLARVKKTKALLLEQRTEDHPPLGELVGTRIYPALKGRGYDTVRQVADADWDTIRVIRGIGPVGIRKIRRAFLDNNVQMHASWDGKPS